MTRRAAGVAGISVLMLIAFAAGYRTRPPLTLPAVPTLDRLTAMGRLDVLRAEVSDVRQSRISGYTGSGSILLILRGQVVIGVDLHRAVLVREGDMNVLVLPAPELTMARVDAEHSAVYRIDRDGLWQMAPSDELSVALINKALVDAQRTIATAGHSDSILATARHATEQLLLQWAAAYGWSVRVQWRDQPSTQPTGDP